MARNRQGFTPTQQRILDVLADGMPHPLTELAAVLNDDMAVKSTVSVHLTHLRKILRPRGQDIICEFIYASGYKLSNRLRYRHVRLLPSATDGRT